MSQLSLNITPCVSYAPEQFVLHRGVRSVLDTCAVFEQPLGAELPKFHIAFLVGGPRSGKTHYSVFLADRVSKVGRFPRLIEATPGMQWKSIAGAHGPSSAEVYIIDEAEKYLSTLKPGDSGDLVSFIESLRVRGAGMVWLSALGIEQFAFDEHVRSRLVPGVGPLFEAPHESELADLLDAMARQRGIALSERKVEYLERRLPRDIRQLEEYLDRVQYIAHVTGRPVRFPLLGDAF